MFKKLLKKDTEPQIRVEPALIIDIIKLGPKNGGGFEVSINIYRQGTSGREAFAARGRTKKEALFNLFDDLKANWCDE